MCNNKRKHKAKLEGTGSGALPDGEEGGEGGAGGEGAEGEGAVKMEGEEDGAGSESGDEEAAEAEAEGEPGTEAEADGDADGEDEEMAEAGAAGVKEEAAAAGAAATPGQGVKEEGGAAGMDVDGEGAEVKAEGGEAAAGGSGEAKEGEAGAGEGGKGKGKGGRTPRGRQPGSGGKGAVLSMQQAAKLRERLILLHTFHFGNELLKPVWREQQVLMNRTGDLPVWWAPQHDGELVTGVLEKGFGLWDDILLATGTSFKSAQAEYMERVGARKKG